GVPIRIAIKIPVNAPPAIKPELKRAPGPISDSSADFFLLSTNHFTSPPIKIGLVVERGRYAPTAKGSERTPLNSITAAIPIPIRTSPQGRFWLSNPLITVAIKVACGAGNGVG